MKYKDPFKQLKSASILNYMYTPLFNHIQPLRRFAHKKYLRYGTAKVHVNVSVSRKMSLKPCIAPLFETR